VLAWIGAWFVLGAAGLHLSLERAFLPTGAD
jgi:uncharacterized membrane protein